MQNSNLLNARPGVEPESMWYLSVIYLGAVFMFLSLLFLCVMYGSPQLTLGITACFLALLYVSIAILYNQLSRNFAILADRIYALENPPVKRSGPDPLHTVIEGDSAHF